MSHTNLSAAEIALLNSQLPEIGGAIRGKPVTTDGDGWRVGSSTKISKNGRWFDFKVQQGDFGAASLIAHYLACTPEEAVTWAQSWLAQHPQRGPCGGADEDDGSGEDNADTLQRRAYIESTYAARLPIAGTPAAAYLVGRGLDPAQLRPDIVERMGWLPNHRGAEGALVFPYTDEAGSLQGLHFTFVTPTGEKSPHEPARQMRRGPPDWRTKGRALLRLDFGTGPEMVVAEGFENALAISLTGADRVVAVGAVGAYGRCPLPRTVETITIAHDGDDPVAKAAAAQAYHRGVVRYLGQGLTLRMTAPPTGCDPNDVLRQGGADALRKLLTEARGDLSKFDDAAFLDEVCRLADIPYDRARETAKNHCDRGAGRQGDPCRELAAKSVSTRGREIHAYRVQRLRSPVGDQRQEWILCAFRLQLGLRFLAYSQWRFGASCRWEPCLGSLSEGRGRTLSTWLGACATWMSVWTCGSCRRWWTGTRPISGSCC